MNTEISDESMIVKDGRSHHLRRMSLKDRVPKFGRNGLPPAGTPYSSGEQHAAIDMCAPENISLPPE